LNIHSSPQQRSPEGMCSKCWKVVVPSFQTDGNWRIMYLDSKRTVIRSVCWSRKVLICIYYKSFRT